MATKRAYDVAADDSSNSNYSAKRSKFENFDSTTSVRFKQKKVLFYIQFF